MVCNFPQWERHTTMKFCAKCLTAVAILLSAVAGSLADAPLQAAVTPVSASARTQNTDPQTTALQNTDQGASPRRRIASHTPGTTGKCGSAAGHGRQVAAHQYDRAAEADFRHGSERSLCHGHYSHTDSGTRTSPRRGFAAHLG